MSKSKVNKISTLCLASVLVLNAVGPTALSVSANTESETSASATNLQTITSMQAAGPTTIDAGFDGGLGFEFPTFNNGASFDDVKGDVDLLVKQDGEWISIDNNAASGWVYDANFGNWWEGPGGYWFNPVEETMQLRVASKANTEVFVEYTFNVTPADTQVITSMAPAGPTTIDVSPSGGTGFEFPRFNTGATFKDVKDDIALFVKQDDTWVSIDNNADSGWIYDNNFGNWWEGPGGYWFDPVEETTSVRVASITNPEAFVDYSLKVTLPVRNSYTITNFDGRATFEADKNGAIGLPSPRIDGGPATKSEVDNFVYEVNVDGEWVNILDSAATGFSYSANGYNRMSSANQWGYWTDYIFGLWFQPLQEDMDLRIGYPLNGEKDGDIGDNYVQYKFIGNPDAHRPDDVAMDDIEVGMSDDPTIDGWDLVWNDEFDGDELDESKWNYETGYYLNDDPGTWGWGNNELQHYTDSKENVFLEDGKLNIVAFEDPASFPEDPDRSAPYSSGKITTQDKFTFEYGRIDFSAKLPAVTGAWSALWMMPNDDVYGGWASSGEIDVLEARGRVPESTSGATHFGGEWPANTYIEGNQTFEDGGRIDTDYHDYSLIWEEDHLSWYVDGEFFFKVSKEQWFSAAARENPLAPFDQEFYVIMNLAIGGWFDGGRVPDAEELPATMQVDYVRVYSEPEPVQVPVTGITLNRSEVELTSEGQRTSLSTTVSPSNATNKKVTWSSSDESVATVSASGAVTAVANGTATITVTTEDGEQIDTATVVVDIIPQLTLDQMFPLKNGTFSDGLTHWSAWNWRDNDEFMNQIEAVNGQAEIAIPAFDASGAGAEKEAVQFKQSGIQLYENEEYLVSFDAHSTISREMELVLQNGEAERIFEKNLSLSEESQRYTYSFKATGDEEVELNFLLGQYADYGEHTVTIDNVALEIKNPAVNQIKNYSFTNGTTSWDMFSDVGASSVVIDEEQQINIPSLGNEFWSIQFSQMGLRLEESKSYRLVFDMSSSIGRKIDTIVESTNYDKYLWETVEIDEEMNTYTLEFTHENGTDPAAKFVLALGKVEGQEAIGEHVVSIDNVYLYEIPALPAGEADEPAEPVTPKEGYGVGTITENSVEFYVNDAPWAIIHYNKNDTTPQNIMMDKAGENYSVYTLNDLKEGDEIIYGFTYGLAEGQDSYAEQVYVHNFVTRPETPTADEVSDRSTEVTGLADAASTVTVANDTEIFTSIADAEGLYTVEIPKQLAGTALTITATDEAGNVSEELTVTVTDRTPPEMPTADEVTDRSTEVTGLAEAASTVTVANDIETFTSIADAEGLYTVEIPKQNTETVLTITATDEAGNVSEELSVTVASGLEVNEITNESKEVTGKAEADSVVTVDFGNKNQRRTVTADSEGNFNVRIPKQKAGSVVEVTVEDVSGTIIDTKVMTVSEHVAPEAPKVKNVDSQSTSVTGKTDAHADVTVKVDDEVIGTTQADDKGKFEVAIPSQKQGTHLSITVADASNNVSPETNVTVKK